MSPFRLAQFPFMEAMKIESPRSTFVSRKRTVAMVVRGREEENDSMTSWHQGQRRQEDPLVRVFLRFVLLNTTTRRFADQRSSKRGD
jgi:hypothetical protein